MSIKNSNGTVGNRTLDLPVCKARSASVTGVNINVTVLCGVTSCMYRSFGGTCNQVANRDKEVSSRGRVHSAVHLPFLYI
jgi:hypothetical protein